MLVLNLCPCTDVDLALTGLVCLTDTAGAVDDCRGGEIGSLYVLHKLVNRAFGVLHSVNRAVNNLAEVVRGDVGRHTDRNTDRAVYKQVREAGGKDGGLISRVIEVAGHRHDILLNVTHHIICNLRHSRLGVTVCRRAVAVNVTEVTVTLNKGVTKREGLRHSYHCAVNGSIAVRMVSTKHVTDGCRRLTEGLIVCKVVLIHCVEDSSLTGLKTVTDIRKSTRRDNRHRVFKEGLFDLLFHIVQLYVLVGEGNIVTFVVMFNLCHVYLS